MEPPEEVGRWVSELLGAPLGEDGPRLAQAWAALGPHLAAVHRAPVPAETEPAVRMLFPPLEDEAAAGGRE